MGAAVFTVAIFLGLLLFLQKALLNYFSPGARRWRYKGTVHGVFSSLSKSAKSGSLPKIKRRPYERTATNPFFSLLTQDWGRLLVDSKGLSGERVINRLITQALDPETYHLIPDVMLPRPGGTTQIDHVVVSRYGIFVLETKNFDGWIFGGEQDAKWTQVLYKRKTRFQNPLRQNYLHTKTLSDLTGIPHKYFKSVVLFVGDSEFKTPMPENVVQGAHHFVDHVKSHQTPVIKDEQVPQIVSVIGEWAGTVTEDEKRRHVNNLRRNKGPVTASAGAPTCPRCGKPMVLRTNRKDGSQFWGCPGYPGCQGTRRTEDGRQRSEIRGRRSGDR